MNPSDERTDPGTLAPLTDELLVAQELAGLGYWVWDLREGRVSWSAGLYRLLGVDPESFTPSHEAFQDLVHPEDRELVRVIVEEALATGRTLHYEYRVVSNDQTRTMQAWGKAVHDDAGEPVLMYGTAQDVTDRKRLEEELQRRAFYDTLTGLANRLLFRDRLEHAIAASERRTNEPIAVLIVDLDGFKEINDILGHDAGDRLLEEVADRLRATMRPTDTAARLGGDEFGVLLRDTDRVGAQQAAARMAEAIREPALLDGREIYPLASIGIAAHEQGNSTTDVLRAADLAMYAAKELGEGSVKVHNADMTATMLRRMELATELRAALDRGEFFLHYQPIVAATDRTIVSVEALLRWQHPTLGLVSPGEFIPIAEATGQIVRVGRWVLAAACRQARTWRARHPGQPGASISVNVSLRQLHEPGFVDEVGDILTETGLEPDHLVLEVTESALAGDFERVVTELAALKKLGVRLAIDDFGTGYSSLSYLRRLPVDAVKIDRSFVSGIATTSSEWSVMLAIVRLMRALNLTPIAEGIKTGKQLAHLRALGCSTIQGYYYSRPLDADKMGELLALGRLPKPGAREGGP